ncbi:MAG: hypothetical protein DRN90_08075 [Thermoproteota archaeon]|nr:MAG: hypothetical protein DRN90_08075 [Candidatus Korarchaeota archaeon]
MTERENIRKGLDAVANVIAAVLLHVSDRGKRRSERKAYELGLRYIDLLVDEPQYKPDMPWSNSRDPKKSRLTTELEKEGLIYNALFFEEGEKKERLYIHPKAIYEMGKEVLGKKGLTPLPEAEIGLEFLCAAWEGKMNGVFEKKWLSPVEGWASEIAYANVIGWAHYLWRNLEKGRALFLTPHLKLLKNDILKSMLRKVAEEYEFSVEFFCFSKSLRECGPVENLIKKNFTFNEIREETPWADELRAIIFEDKNGEPLFGLEVLKQPERERYVGTLYCMMEDGLRRIKKNIELISRNYVVKKFPERRGQELES